MSFGERVRELLEEWDITQKQLAGELHIAKSTLNGYLTGERQPDCGIVVNMAAYFGVTTDYLLGVTNIRKGTDSNLTVHEGKLVGIYRDLEPATQDLLLDQAAFYSKREKRQRGSGKDNK